MNGKWFLVIIIIVVALGVYAFVRPDNNMTKTSFTVQSTQQATIKTSVGNIIVELYGNDAPQTVNNFISLASKDFYNGIPFHRVVAGFVIQAGDPLCANPPRGNGPCGTGGPGYRFADELNPATPSYQQGYKKGVLAMANSGPNTNGSQFFIMLEDNPMLPPDYTIFGRVIFGQDVVDAIGRVEVDANDMPLMPVFIESIQIGK